MDGNTVRLRIFFTVLVVASPIAAIAQPAYVGASLVGHIARFATVDTAPVLFSGDLTNDGETFGFGLVAGTALGDRWGVELEFVRPGALERTARTEVILPPAIPVPLPLPFPIIEYEIRAEERHTTLTAAAWFRQRLSDRAELAYLGGVAFVRTTRDQTIGIDPRILALSIPVEQNLTEHTVGPMVGIEGRIRLTRQLALTPGIRLLAVTAGGRDGWLIRPGVGVHWIF